MDETTRCPERPFPRFCFRPTEQNPFVCQTASSPWIRSVMEPRASPGASLPLLSESDRRDSPGIQHSDKERKREASLRPGEPGQRAEGQVLLSLLRRQPAAPDLPFCPSSELARTPEGLPPDWSSRPLCVTANSSGQPDDSKYLLNTVSISWSFGTTPRTARNDKHSHGSTSPKPRGACRLDFGFCDSHGATQSLWGNNKSRSN